MSAKVPRSVMILKANIKINVEIRILDLQRSEEKQGKPQKKFFFLSGLALVPPPPLSGRATNEELSFLRLP